MKKTVLDGKQWILELLLKAGINNVISGKIYKDKRPADSQKEDIVINSLTMTNHFLGLFGGVDGGAEQRDVRPLCAHLSDGT